MDTEMLISSLRIACHQPGGMDSVSPGSSTQHMDWGSTLSRNNGCIVAVSEKMSRDDVFSSEVDEAGFTGCEIV